jgi:hypothetical protein
MKAAWYCTFQVRRKKRRAEHNAGPHQNSDRINAANKRKWRYSNCYTDAFCYGRTLRETGGSGHGDAPVCGHAVRQQLVRKPHGFLLGSNFRCWRRFYHGPGRLGILSCRGTNGRQHHVPLQRGNVRNRMFRYPNARHLNTNAFGVGSTWRLHGRWRDM